MQENYCKGPWLPTPCDTTEDKPGHNSGPFDQRKSMIVSQYDTRMPLLHLKQEIQIIW